VRYRAATASHPDTPRFERADPWLGVEASLACGRAWAYPDDPARPETSPLFGEFAGINRLLVFTGTRDTLHPQARQIAARAEAAGVPCRLVTAPGCTHGYPLLPIREASRAMSDISRFIETAAR